MIFNFRLVYKWFLLLYKVSYFIGILGYIIMMATFMGFYLFFGVKPHVWMDIGIMMMFYALYYGVMARDVAEIITEKMVSGIGVMNNLNFYNIIQAKAQISQVITSWTVDLYPYFFFLVLQTWWNASP